MSWLVPLDIGLSMGLLFAWVVLALALGFRLLNFPDLTVEGSFPLGAALFAMLLKSGLNMPVSILAGVLGGGLAGALTGYLHVRFKVNKFLAGIIVIAITYSLSLRIMGASNIGLLTLPSIFDLVAKFDNLTAIRLHLGTLLLLVVLIVASAALIVAILSTRQGLRLRVAGSNPQYAKSLGVNVPVNMVIGLAATNAFAAFSGILLAMHQGFADVGMGQGILILALAAMTIGERLLPEKSLPFHAFVVFSAIIGSLAYQILIAFAIRAGLAPTDLKLATALLVLAVVVMRISKNENLLSDLL